MIESPSAIHNDKLLDEQGRRIWVKAMNKIEQLLDGQNAPNPDMLGSLASVASAATEQIMEQEEAKDY